MNFHFYCCLTGEGSIPVSNLQEQSYEGGDIMTTFSKSERLNNNASAISNSSSYTQLSCTDSIMQIDSLKRNVNDKSMNMENKNPNENQLAVSLRPNDIKADPLDKTGAHLRNQINFPCNEVAVSKVLS